MLRTTNRINNVCAADTSLNLNIFKNLNEPYLKSILKVAYSLYGIMSLLAGTDTIMHDKYT